MTSANGHGRHLDLRNLDPRSYSGMTGLARLAVSTTVRTAGWATRSSVQVAVDLVRDVNAGEPITEIVDSRLEAVRSTVWRALGIDRLDKRIGAASAMSPVKLTREPRQSREREPATLSDIRLQGDDLVRQLGDPQSPPRDEHPAFSRMLRELVPDEARILRFMALAGPQPAIDVRTKTPLGVGSELLADAINLVAEMSGCTYPDRNRQYLANLTRLGMIQFSEEQVDDPRRYSFIEAQPEASRAMDRAKKAMTVYRSIHITHFGQQFCEVCFTLDGYDAGGWLKDVR